MRTLSRLVALAFATALLPAAALGEPPALVATWPACCRPTGIAFDRSGRALVAEYSPSHIDVFAPDGLLASQWGSDGQDPGSVAGPGYVAIDNLDHLFVSEQVHNYQQSGVQEFTTDGTFVASIGSLWVPGTPLSGPGVFFEASGIAVDGGGRVYVTDVGIPRTQVFSNDRAYLYEWASEGNSIALDDFGHAFEVEEGGVVRKYTTEGIELAHWGNPGSGPGQFDQPHGIAVDHSGNVYVADTYNHRVQVFTSDGAFLMQWGSYGSAPGQFYRPMGVEVGTDGRIYVADTWNARIQIFGPLATPTVPSSWGRLKRIYR